MDDIFYVGNTAYGDVNTNDTLIKKMMGSVEYPIYSGKIVLQSSSDEQTKAKFSDKYVKRVPDMDKDIIILG